MIITSIVTIPNRLESLFIVLDSLLNQSIIPDFLYVSLCNYYPRSNKYFSNEEKVKLSLFLSNFKIPNKIIEYDTDIGPLLKLVTPLKNHLNIDNDSFIFTIDDDTPLYEKTLECLLLSYSKNKDAIYGFSGVRENNFIHSEFLPENFDYFVVDVLGGYRGILYATHLINKNDFFEWINMFINFSKKYNLIPMHDDHIFSYYFKYKNISRRVSNNPFSKKFIYTPIDNNDGIFNDKNAGLSYEILKNTLIENKLEWVLYNKY